MAHEVGLRLGCDETELGAAPARRGAPRRRQARRSPTTILNKPGPLTDDEFAEVRAHPEIGARMVALDRALCGLRFRGVLFHHERWDGGGYPTRLLGRPDPARGADPRGRRQLRRDDLRPPVPRRRCRRRAPSREVDRCAGTQFDPDVAVAFLAAWESGALGVTAALRAAAG